MSKQSRNFHQSSFSTQTQLKLELMGGYIEEWFGTLVTSKQGMPQDLEIFDFFSGPGGSKDGVLGSPLRIIEKVKSFDTLLRENGKRVTLHFNDIDEEKINRLKCKIESELVGYDYVKTHFYSKDFKSLFHEISSQKNFSMKLLLIDQFGVKQVDQDVFSAMVAMEKTDFIFFISSSTLKRFIRVPEIKSKFDGFPENVDSHYIHRAVVEYYREKIPSLKQYFIGGFSLKKESNIYGIVVGTSHVRGMINFLKIAWSKDEYRGEANYDIDREGLDPLQSAIQDSSDQMSLFKPKDYQLPASKIVIFNETLRNKILSKELITNKEVFFFTIAEGMLPKHAKVVTEEMRKEGLILNKRLNLSQETYKQKPVTILLKDGT